MVAESMRDDVAGNGDDMQIYQALADERRRHVFGALQDADDSLLLMELARHVTERETDGTSTPADEEIRRCRISLYHCHLPKLSDAGLVRFDTDQKVASLVADVPVDV